MFNMSISQQYGEITTNRVQPRQQKIDPSNVIIIIITF